jgi:serine/threonine-protein kinase
MVLVELTYSRLVAQMHNRGLFRKWTLKLAKLVLLFSALGLTYGLFAFVGLQVALKTREVAVPTLTDLTTQQAQEVLSQVDLGLRIEPLRRVHQTIQAGQIVEQDPDPGITTRQGRNVKIWLSSGLTPGSVPTLVGASERAARTRLDQNSFGLQGLSEIRSSRYPIDAIVAQDPPPAGNGQAVWLLVNRGERGRTFVMPDLIGVDAITASEILRASGFRVTVVGSHPYPGLSSGIVLRQSPEAGFQIAPGEPISLEVSQ